MASLRVLDARSWNLTLGRDARSRKVELDARPVGMKLGVEGPMKVRREVF